MSTTPLRILLAEDDLINRKVALHILGKLGCEADAAENGAEALEKGGRESYDLILMDMQMPEMDGLEAARRLRDLGRTMPIIALTGDGSEKARQSVLEAGMNDLLQKPVTPEKLMPLFSRYAPAPKL